MFGRTLWKGPRICSPAYDLKLRFTKCVIIRRGAPGSLVIAGGGGGGMLPRISSKLRLSAASAASPWDGSVAQKEEERKKEKKKYNFFLIPLCESFQVGDSDAWGRGGGARKKTNKQNTGSKLQQRVKQRLPRKLTGVIFLCSWKQEPTPEKKEKKKEEKKKQKETMAAFMTNPHYYTNALHEKRSYVRAEAPHSFRRW